MVDIAEVGQAKASEKEIGLAWERIETFSWKHVGPHVSAYSDGQTASHTHGQHNGQMQDNDVVSSQISTTDGTASA